MCRIFECKHCDQRCTDDPRLPKPQIEEACTGFETVFGPQLRDAALQCPKLVWVDTNQQCENCIQHRVADLRTFFRRVSWVTAASQRQRANSLDVALDGFMRARALFDDVESIADNLSVEYSSDHDESELDLLPPDRLTVSPLRATLFGAPIRRHSGHASSSVAIPETSSTPGLQGTEPEGAQLLHTTTTTPTRSEVDLIIAAGTNAQQARALGPRVRRVVQHLAEPQHAPRPEHRIPQKAVPVQQDSAAPRARFEEQAAREPSGDESRHAGRRRHTDAAPRRRRAGFVDRVLHGMVEDGRQQTLMK